MKSTNYVGNSSQSVVPVPGFFLTRKLKSIDTFNNNTTKKKKNFSEKELFSRTRDMNFNHNYRNNDKQFEEYNRRRVIPRARKEIKTISSSLNSKDFPTGARLPKEIYDFEKFNQYLDKITSERRATEKKEEIRNNINDIIERLSPNYNFEAALQTKRNTELRTQSTNFPQLTFNTLGLSADRKGTMSFFNTNENESEKFQKSIMNKMTSLSVNNFLKTQMSQMHTQHSYDSDIFTMKTKSKTYIPTNRSSNFNIYNSNMLKSEMGSYPDINLATTSEYRNEMMSNKTSGDRIYFGKRKNTDFLVQTDTYNSSTIRTNFKPKSSIVHEPFYN